MYKTDFICTYQHVQDEEIINNKYRDDLLDILDLEIFESFRSLSSGTITSPIFGSIVQNGKFAACALLDFVKAFTKVDFHTF